MKKEENKIKDASEELETVVVDGEEFTTTDVMDEDLSITTDFEDVANQFVTPKDKHRARIMMYTQRLDIILANFQTLDDFEDCIKTNVCTNPNDKFAYIIHDNDTSKNPNQMFALEHLHLALDFENPHSLTSIAKLLKDFRKDGSPNTQTLTIFKGNVNNAYSYLCHRTKKAAGKYQYDPKDVVANFDYVTLLEQTTKEVKSARDLKKVNINVVLDNIVNGVMTIKEAKELLSGAAYTKNINYLNNAQAEAMRRNADKWRKNKKENNIPTVVIWLWGNSDTGKTSMAKEMATSSGQPYYLSGSSRGMWDNYDSNMHIAILDECRPEMFETYRDMLSILDPYQERAVAPARYYDRELALDTIIITSVYDPYAFYKHMIEPEKRNVDSFRQLERRITYSIHVEDYFFMLSHFEDKEVGYVNDVDTLIANPYSKVKRGEIVISDRNRNYSNLMHALPSVSQHDNIDESYYCNADGEEDEMQLYEDVSDQLEACEAWKEAQDNAMLEEEQYQSGIGGEKESEDAHDEDDNNRGEYDEYDETNERIYDEHEKNKLESEKYAEDELEKEDWQKKDIKEIE